jgi:radical SAM superfamily enzyme YgiQ (UPF0313 family)
LISIASYLKKKLSGLEIDIVDGQKFQQVDDILPLINGDIIGFSVLAFNYKSTLKLSRQAKSIGAITVWGNDQATRLYNEILLTHTDIDFIVLGDYGEFAFCELVEKILYLKTEKSFGDIYNIAFNDEQNGSVVSTCHQKYRLDELPMIDRSVFSNYSTYFDNYNSRYGGFHKSKIYNMSTNFAKGCGWGQHSDNRCLYCDIHDLQMDYVHPKRVWDEIAYLKSSFGTNYIYEVCDNFTSLANIKIDGKSYLDLLIDLKPDSLNDVEWFVYSRASDINESILDKLKRIGVTRINIGFDSGDAFMLKTLSKGATQRTNERAIRLLFENNLQLYCSFVLGSIAESAESLENTVEFARLIQTYGKEKLIALTVSPLCPLPGSKAWELLVDPKIGIEYCKKFNFMPTYADDYAKKYANTEYIDVDVTALDWITTFCLVSAEQVWNATKRIQNISSSAGAFTGGFGLVEPK